MENNHNIVEDEEVEPIATRSITHKVKKGETLHALANKYDTNAKALMKINHLKNAQLKAGQSLRIKDVAIINTRLKSAGNKSSVHKVASRSNYKKVNSHKITFKSKRKTSGHIRVRSHIRLK
jgi:LysM repeat protein